MKPVDPRQSSLFADEPVGQRGPYATTSSPTQTNELVVNSVSDRRVIAEAIKTWVAKKQAAVVEAPAPSLSSYASGLKEQIIRDSRVLAEDPVYHVPDTQFFVDRIASYRSELSRILGASHG